MRGMFMLFRLLSMLLRGFGGGRLMGGGGLMRGGGMRRGGGLMKGGRLLGKGGKKRL